MCTENQYFIGSKKYLLKTEDDKSKLRERIRQLLNVRHVNLLVGNGASLSIGAPKISTIRDESLRKFLSDSAKHIDTILGKNKIGIEPFLGLLSHVLAVSDINGDETKSYKEIEYGELRKLQNEIKKWLYLECDKFAQDITADKLKYHSDLIKKMLLRPVSLPRLKIFTINYDLVIEKTLDLLGVSYFDGFVGTVDRRMRPESYHYDLYFPGETTEGRVSRVDRVVQLYKLHGSVNWKRRIEGNLHEVVQGNFSENDNYEDLLIYPSPLKYDEIHGYPYSEMFRHFSSALYKPQNVLFTIGYGFRDSHINRIIYQAMNIPSFSLVIVLPDYETNDEIKRLVQEVSSERVLFVTGMQNDYKNGAGILQEFVNDYLPDMEELDLQKKIKEETDRLFKNAVKDEVDDVTGENNDNE